MARRWTLPDEPARDAGGIPHRSPHRHAGDQAWYGILLPYLDRLPSLGRQRGRECLGRVDGRHLQRVRYLVRH